MRQLAKWFALLGLVGTPLSASAQSTVMISQTQPGAAPLLHGAGTIGHRPNTPFLYRIAATGMAPLTFAATGLPAGLMLDTKTGIITGTVTAQTEAQVTLRVSNTAGMKERVVAFEFDDTLALTPPIGWNSYDSFDDSVNQEEFLAQAKWMSENLQPYGWDTVVLDFRWYDPNAPSSDQTQQNSNLTIDDNGRFQPSTNRFPSAAGGVGFKYIADQVHALGLKFGIHIMRGIPRLAVNDNRTIAGSTLTARDAARASNDNGYTCVWNADMYGVRGNTAAGQAWYNSILSQYAQWGIDFIKVDDATKNRPENQLEYHQSEVEAIQNAIHASGRSIVLSLSPGESLVSAAQHMTTHANMWRMSDDFWDTWSALDYTFTLAQRWQSHGAVGHYPDADMLPIGRLAPRCPINGANRNTNFTQNEQVLMLSLWAVLPSPNFLGANMVMSASNQFFMSLVRNEEVLAVHQDGLGAKGKNVVRSGNREVWSRPLAGGKTAVGFFNRGSTDQMVSVSAAQLGVTAKQLVRNTWTRSDLPALEAGAMLQVNVPNHAGALLVLSPEAPVAAGGAGGTGGSAGAGGLAGAGGSAGMAAGGSVAEGGTAGAGGVAGAASGGVSGAASSGTGGVVAEAGSAGAAVAGGVSGAGAVGAGAGGSASGMSGAPSVSTPSSGAEGSGCGCKVAGSPRENAFALGLSALAVVLGAYRRRARC